MNISPGEGYRVPKKSELHPGMIVEIYDQSTVKLIRSVKWHSVLITDQTYSETGKTIAHNSLRKRIASGCIRVPKKMKPVFTEENAIELQIISLALLFGTSADPVKDRARQQELISLYHTLVYVKDENNPREEDPIAD